MAAEFDGIFTVLKSVLASMCKRLSVKTDTGVEYTLVTRSASPFPQHKGQGLAFAPCGSAKRM